MRRQSGHTRLWVFSICTVALMLGACQKSSESGQIKETEVALIEAKVLPVALAKNKFCDEDGCTTYDLQTVQTNLAWIDEYFLKRMQKDVPNAFNAAAGQDQSKDKAQLLSQSLIHVRFIGQNYHLAQFEMASYIYAAGAAHGLQHNEYVNFDLKQKKRIALNDLLKPNLESKLLIALYENNSMWLEQHKIEPAQLKLSDNYYYGADGIVFVYPLYELASYAEGMSELTLPYSVAKDFVKAQYLPSLPKYQQL